MGDSNSTMLRNTSDRRPPPPSKLECPEFTAWNVYNFNLIPAICIVVVLCFLRKRTFKCPGVCGGRPGLQVPVNFIDENEKRWAYAFAFGCMTENILNLFAGEYLWLPEAFSDPVFAAEYAWLKTFVAMVNVLEVCILFYPFVACIAARRSIIANLLGLGYTLEWLFLSVAKLVVCPWNSPDGTIIGAFYMIYDIPVIFCNLMVVLSNMLDLLNNILQLCNRKILCARTGKEDSICVKYVRHLFKKEDLAKSSSFLVKIKRACTYRRIHGFRYSPRVICTMLAAFFVLWKVVLLFVYVVELLFHRLQNALDTFDLVDGFFRWLGISHSFQFFKEGVGIAYTELYACMLFSVLYQIASMVHMVICYRDHLGKVLKGDRSWMYRGMEGSPANAVVYCLRYSGYQIAYICWSFLVMIVVLFLVIFALTYLVVIPVRDGYTTFILDQIKALWPTVVVGFIIFYLQVLLAKCVLLIDRGPHLALNNRNTFHVLTYFLFVFNVLLGLFSCLLRILLALGFGLLTFGRLDRSSLMRDWESFDAGYKSYMGMLELEATHNHPIVKAFLEVVQKQVIVGSGDLSAIHPAERVENGILKTGLPTKILTDSTSRIHKKWPKNKWMLAVTLSRNLSLTVDRIRLRTEQELKAHETIRTRWEESGHDVTFAKLVAESSAHTHL